MNQILKRLELIKTAIELDDEEIIELQLIKLEKLDIDKEIKNILSKLKNLDYGEVAVDIENYLKRHKEVAPYQDPQVQSLKLELKTLEKKLQTLIETKTEYLNDIDEFNRLYHIKLGSLIEEILKLKQEISEKELKAKQERYKEEQSLHVETQDVYDDIKSKVEKIEEVLEDIDEDDERYDEINQIYEELKESLKELEDELETQRENLEEFEDELENEKFDDIRAEYEEFRDEYKQIKEQSKKIYDLSKDEKTELKKLWKKASRLCHPDIVVDKLKKQAHKIMQALNEAYSKKDLKSVQKILDNLKNGIAFEIASDKIDDKKVLKAKIAELREKIEQINSEIEELKQDETFEIITEIDDWDEYFQSVKEALKEEKESLANRVFSKELHVEKQPTIKTTSVKQENSKQSKELKEIELVTFEKIRRYYSNLEDADELQEEFATEGKKYKALIYSAADVFLDRLEGQKINIVDWDCKQGLASTLVLDFIREKQLDIEVSDILFVEEDKKALSRAMMHVDVIKEKTLHIKSIYKPLKDIEFSELSFENENITLFLGVKSDSKAYLDIMDENLDTPIYYLFIDEDYDKNIDEIYEYFKENFEVELISKREGKIGRYRRYEEIWMVEGYSDMSDANISYEIPDIEIDEDEIPF